MTVLLFAVLGDVVMSVLTRADCFVQQVRRQTVRFVHCNGEFDRSIRLVSPPRILDHKDATCLVAALRENWGAQIVEFALTLDFTIKKHLWLFIICM
jgi:hypothetical protein